MLGSRWVYHTLRPKRLLDDAFAWEWWLRSFQTYHRVVHSASLRWPRRNFPTYDRCTHEEAEWWTLHYKIHKIDYRRTTCHLKLVLECRWVVWNGQHHRSVVQVPQCHHGRHWWLWSWGNQVTPRRSRPTAPIHLLARLGRESRPFALLQPHRKWVLPADTASTYIDNRRRI